MKLKIESDKYQFVDLMYGIKRIRTCLSAPLPDKIQLKTE